MAKELGKTTKNGIRCPRCFCRDLRTIRTRHMGEMTFRWKKCRHCGYSGRQVRTVEKIESPTVRPV